jgi:hypothetical protein
MFNQERGLGFGEGSANVGVLDHDCQKIEQSTHAEDLVEMGMRGLYKWICMVAIRPYWSL